MSSLFNIRFEDTLYGRIRTELDQAAEQVAETLETARAERMEHDTERVKQAAADARERAEGIAVRLEGLGATLAAAEQVRMDHECTRLEAADELMDSIRASLGQVSGRLSEVLAQNGFSRR
ncbi:MAG: hypothetical protein Tsb0013_10480 [Phycisphaerales bacterium]